MAKRTASRPANPYGHFAGISAADPDDKNNPAPEGEDGKEKAPDIEDDTTPLDEGDDTKTEPSGRKSEDPDPEEDGALSEEEMDKEDEEADEADEKEEAEDDEEDREVRKSAKASHRSRCKAILRRPEAAANLPLAMHLAFDTNTSRVEAVRTLKAATAGSTRRSGRRNSGGTTASLRSRMGRNHIRPARPSGQSKTGLLSAVDRLNNRNA